MKIMLLLYFFLLFNPMLFFSEIKPKIFKQNFKVDQFNAIFRVDSQDKGYPLKIVNNKVQFFTKKEGRDQNFRIKSTGTKKDSFFIISKPYSKKVGINDSGEVILYNNNITDDERVIWIFIKINDKEYLLQNSFNKKFMEIKSRKEGKATIFFPVCISNLDGLFESSDFDKIPKIYKYSFFKLCEEVEIKPEHLEIIDKEPIDILIKYIDLSDKTLNREGITQIKKDEDHEELRYAVRSILENIPWIRKIFILMPNEKVKYFRPIEEISGKFVYVKDKDLLGFDSANSIVFQLNLGNMSKFGLSENFILIDDDCFFGKPIKKSDFFYYDEIQKKVVPAVITDDFSEIVKNDILNEYNKYYRRIKTIKPHAFEGWKISQLAAYKLLFENYDPPLINAGFNHNAVALNIYDIKEIHELIVNKYQYSKETLTSKSRTNYDLQPQSLFMSYALNVKKRKVNSIPYAYYDVAFLDGKNLDIELFVLNTSGDRKYADSLYVKSKNLIEKKFPIPTPFELGTVVTKINGVQKTIDLNDYVKKTDYNNLKMKLEEVEKKGKELNKKIEEVNKSKEQIEKKLKEEIAYLLENIHSNYLNSNTSNTSNTSNNASILNETLENIRINQRKKEDIMEEYNLLKIIFQIMVGILLFIAFTTIFCLCYNSKYKEMKGNEFDNNKELQMANLVKTDNTFTKLSTEEKY